MDEQIKNIIILVPKKCGIKYFVTQYFFTCSTSYNLIKVGDVDKINTPNTVLATLFITLLSLIFNLLNIKKIKTEARTTKILL